MTALVSPLACAAALRCGSAKRVSICAERTLRLITSAKKASSISATGLRATSPPALLISTSMPPKRARKSASNFSHCAVCDRSAGKNAASPPPDFISASTASNPAGSLRAFTPTRAPWRAKACAAARPMPALEPVIKTRLPRKSSNISLSSIQSPVAAVFLRRPTSSFNNGSLSAPPAPACRPT